MFALVGLLTLKFLTLAFLWLLCVYDTLLLQQEMQENISDDPSHLLMMSNGALM